ncbi:YihY/virulence factor BrkB family protein [Geodermatophilus amargosae]|uniref:YihY/virulence factor BrkB family protein n=1 Tax=Geodermatophilus amargosae TaxID=1296565 RepID=UPI0034E015C3
MARARQEDPASAARSPHHLSARDWRRVLRRVGAHVLGERLMVQASAVAFFAILSVAPVLVTAVSVYGVVNTPEEALEELSGLVRMLPPDLRSLVEEQLTTIASASTNVLTWRGLGGLAAALWTATTAMTYLVDGLTLAYRETETRGFLRRSGQALFLVLCGAVLLAGAIAVGGLASSALDGAPGPVRAAVPALSWVAAAVVMSAVLAVLYRFGPDRRQARWRWLTPGSSVATLLWLAATIGFFSYVRSLGDYAATYGSLAGVAISMVWLWTTVFLVIVGAAVNAEAERQTVRDSTVGPEQPIGERGAVVADDAPPFPRER